MEIVGAAGNVAAGLDLVEHAIAGVRDRRHPAARRQRDRPDARALARRPELGVILYTGDSDAELLYSGLDSGARGYALKAGSMAELARRDRADRGGRLVRRPAPGPHPALAAGDRAACPQLSPREREIMHLMAEGRTAEAIADELSVSVETVRTHVRNVIRKLQARNRVHAIASHSSAVRSRWTIRRR